MVEGLSRQLRNKRSTIPHEERFFAELGEIDSKESKRVGVINGLVNELKFAHVHVLLTHEILESVHVVVFGGALLPRRPLFQHSAEQHLWWF